MSKKKYRIIPAKKMSKFLAKQPENIRIRLITAMEKLQSFPPDGDIKSLKGGKGFLRLRVGSFRIIFEINHQERIVYIQSLDNRGDVYK